MAKLIWNFPDEKYKDKKYPILDINNPKHLIYLQNIRAAKALSNVSERKGSLLDLVVIE